MTDKWQYRAVELWRGHGTNAEAVEAAFQKELRIAGEEGWEVLGEVGLKFSNVDGQQLLRQLLMKKRL